jgi:hypothetical protein
MSSNSSHTRPYRLPIGADFLLITSRLLPRTARGRRDVRGEAGGGRAEGSNVAERGAIEDVGFLAGSKRGASSRFLFSRSRWI